MKLKKDTTACIFFAGDNEGRVISVAQARSWIKFFKKLFHFRERVNYGFIYIYIYIFALFSFLRGMNMGTRGSVYMYTEGIFW